MPRTFKTVLELYGCCMVKLCNEICVCSLMGWDVLYPLSFCVIMTNADRSANAMKGQLYFSTFDKSCMLHDI